MNGDGRCRSLIFPDLTDEGFLSPDDDGFIAGLHFIGPAAGAFPGEVFKAFGRKVRCF